MYSHHTLFSCCAALLVVSLPMPAAGSLAPASHPATSPAPAAKVEPATPNPSLKYPTLAAYEKTIGEPGLVLDSPHVQFFAPKRKDSESNIIFPYLVRAYDELYKIVGVHTEYKIVIYSLPRNHPDFSGGTTNCTLWYSYDNLDLAAQSEWKQYKVPHVSGYIEEMAHNFVSVTRAQFGWEMIGWTIGIKVSQKVAGNPILAREVQDTRQGQSRTYQRYVQADFRFPVGPDLPANQCDRIHAWLLYQAELKYGPNFWPDFFTCIRRQRESLDEAARIGDLDQNRNARYRITIDCFDKLDKVHFKDALRQAHISLTTDVKALHPTEPGWDGRFAPPAER